MNFSGEVPTGHHDTQSTIVPRSSCHSRKNWALWTFLSVLPLSCILFPNPNLNLSLGLSEIWVLYSQPDKGDAETIGRQIFFLQSSFYNGEKRRSEGWGWPKDRKCIFILIGWCLSIPELFTQTSLGWDKEFRVFTVPLYLLTLVLNDTVLGILRNHLIWSLFLIDFYQWTVVGYFCPFMVMLWG